MAYLCEKTQHVGPEEAVGAGKENFGSHFVLCSCFGFIRHLSRLSPFKETHAYTSSGETAKLATL
jgi:hypothetical protein